MKQKIITNQKINMKSNLINYNNKFNYNQMKLINYKINTIRFNKVIMMINYYKKIIKTILKNKIRLSTIYKIN